MRSAPKAMEAAPEAQAMTTVSLGPPRPSRQPMTSEWLAGRMERSAPIFGEGPGWSASSQYHASPSSMPPPTAPTMSAMSVRSRGERSASASASRAAARARRSARERRRETPRPPMTSAGTSAAMRERKPSVSMTVSGRMAHSPVERPAQNVLTPAPYGLTTPRPLTTTRVISPSRGRSGTGYRGKESHRRGSRSRR